MRLSFPLSQAPSWRPTERILYTMEYPIPFLSGSMILNTGVVAHEYVETRFIASELRNESQELFPSKEKGSVFHPIVGQLLENKNRKHSGGHVFLWGDSSCFDDHQLPKRSGHSLASLYALILTHVASKSTLATERDFLDLVTVPEAMNKFFAAMDPIFTGTLSRQSSMQLHHREDLPHCIPLLTRLITCVQESKCESLKDLENSMK